MSFQYTANYRYIDITLKSRWEPFTTLEREMLAFVPRPNSDFEAERSSLLDQTRHANPDAPIEQLTEWVDSQIRSRTPAQAQIATKFEDRFISEYVNVAVLSHALCEAAINGILALGLSQIGSPELFDLLENASIKEKWLLGPKSLSSGWTLPRGESLYQVLNQLTKDRNALTHHKITLHTFGKRGGDKTVLKGSIFERKGYAEESRWIRRFFSLPYDLTEYAYATLFNLGRPIPLLSLNREVIEPPRLSSGAKLHKTG